MSARKSRAGQRQPPKRRLSRFERETERRRAEMLGHIAGRTSHVSRHSVNKAPLWKDAPLGAVRTMRAKPGRKT